MLDISDPSTIGNMLCAVIILYFLYILYFDNSSGEKRGTIRQQLWAFLHLPLHLALVLAVEVRQCRSLLLNECSEESTKCFQGMCQAITWRAAVVAGGNAEGAVHADLHHARTLNGSWSDDPVIWQDRATLLNDTAIEVLRDGVANSASWDQTKYLIGPALDNIDIAVSVVSDGAKDPHQAVEAATLIVETVWTIILQTAGFEATTPGEIEAPGYSAGNAIPESAQTAKTDCRSISHLLNHRIC